MKAPRSDCEARATTALPEAQALVTELEAAYAALEIRPDEEWYALIGEGYDLCLEGARYRPGQESSGQTDILGRFACGGFAIRALPVIAQTMNALPTLLATIARLQAELDGVREKALRDAAATVLRMMADCNPVHASLGLKTQQEYIADAILALIHEPSDGEGK